MTCDRITAACDDDQQITAEAIGNEMTEHVPTSRDAVSNEAERLDCHIADIARQHCVMSEM